MKLSKELCKYLQMQALYIFAPVDYEQKTYGSQNSFSNYLCLTESNDGALNKLQPAIQSPGKHMDYQQTRAWSSVPEAQFPGMWGLV